MSATTSADAWDEVELGDVVTLHRGYDLPSSQRRSGTVPIVSSSGITGYHDEAKISPPGVVTGRYGTLGEVFFVEEPFWPLNTTLYVSDFHSNDERFVSYFLRCQSIGTQGGAAAVPGVNRNVLHRLPVRRPPLATQRKIAAILSSYDDLIENNNRRIKILEEMAQRIYREWFVDFRYPGHQSVQLVDSALGPIPKGWQAVALGDAAVVSWGDTSTTKAKYVDAGFPAYSASGMDGFLPYFDHDHDGIVLSAIGANCGKTWFASGKWSCIKNTIWLRPRVATMPTEYLYFATHIPGYWPRRGSAQPFIALGDARGVRLVVPPNDLLTAFDDAVSTMVKAITTLRADSENLRASRDLLLPRLISGEIDVTDLDIALPEVAA